MLCPNCKKEIIEDKKFCTNCGAKIDRVKKISDTGETLANENLSKEDILAMAMLVNEAKRVANKLILSGMGWIVAGLAITGITYSFAEAGGTYYIFWGLCVYGAYRLIKGIYYRVMPHKLIEKAMSDNKSTSKEK